MSALRWSSTCAVDHVIVSKYPLSIAALQRTMATSSPKGPESIDVPSKTSGMGGVSGKLETDEPELLLDEADKKLICEQLFAILKAKCAKRIADRTKAAAVQFAAEEEEKQKTTKKRKQPEVDTTGHQTQIE